MKAQRLVILDWDTMLADKSRNMTPTIFSKAAKNVDTFSATKPEEVIAHIGDADVVLTNKVRITREILDACPQIKFIGVLAAGYDNVDVKAAAERGIPVCTAGGYAKYGVGQLVFSYMLDHFQKLPLYAADVRLGAWEKSPTFTHYSYPIETLRGKTIGIVGFGQIGQYVAQLAEAFGMRVMVSTRTVPENADDCPYMFFPLEEMLRLVDVLSLHCPLTEETRHMLSARDLHKMKRSAILINTARGGIIDEESLAAALECDVIAAAYLDVLEKEPMSPDSPLKRAKNCVITPHIGWAAEHTRHDLLRITLENICYWQEGTPRNVVNGVLPEKPNTEGL